MRSAGACDVKGADVHPNAGTFLAEQSCHSRHARNEAISIALGRRGLMWDNGKKDFISNFIISNFWSPLVSLSRLICIGKPFDGQIRYLPPRLDTLVRLPLPLARQLVSPADRAWLKVINPTWFQPCGSNADASSA